MRPTIHFFAAGIPKAQPRARARAFGKFARVYNPNTADDWKMIVRNEAKKAWDGIPLEGPLRVDLFFYFPRPKSHFRSNGTLKENAPRWHTSKPDRDNCDKAVLDCLTQLGMWKDDKQVCDGRIQKFYTVLDAPGCSIKISEAQEQ